MDAKELKKVRQELVELRREHQRVEGRIARLEQQFAGVFMGIAWLAESAGLLYLARRLQNHGAAYAGLAVLALGLISTYRHLAMLWRCDTFFFNVPTLILFSSLGALLLAVKFSGEIKNLGMKNCPSAMTLSSIVIFVSGSWMRIMSL
ncbi:MAG: hypothetical protein C4582_07210 [Desulfobacteraceae bacterium]|jgi:uncharacterized membrane protein YjjP (DUF1212 family)|nr:MAG: hypothetical protein C4582_07210 [Desulfobacteraceae bacterium]